MNTLGWYLESTSARLTSAGVITARLDCLVLMEDVIGEDRSYILAHPEVELNDVQLRELEEKIARRSRHEPLAYIRGKSEFFGREFIVTANTLQPRPETETMIELLLEMENGKLKKQNIIDVGTGSGCLAITAKLELPDCRVSATDISAEALDIAMRNARNLQVEINFQQGHLLAPLLSITYNLPPTILANLPYVPKSYPINESARFEPDVALFAGDDGLDLYRELFTQCRKFSRPPDTVFTESLPEQHGALADIATEHGYKLQQSSGFIQVFTAPA